MLKNINYKDDPLYNEKRTNSPYYDEVKFMWKTGEYCKSCEDCKNRDGVVKTYKGWEEIGMPYSKILDCAPNNECDCTWEPIHDDMEGEVLVCRNCDNEYKRGSWGMLMLPLLAIKLDCDVCKSEQFFDRKINEDSIK